MKLRLAAIALIVVGVGAVVLTLVGPSFGASPSSQYITSQVSTGAVTATSVATGTVAASTVYGLKFGASADIVASASTTSGGGGSTVGSNSSSGNTTLTWPVQTVTVKVGQTVKKGDVLATADSTAAQLQLASAQASLASAQSKLQTDQNGPDSVTLAQAKNQLSQSYNSYKQAVSSRSSTSAQNALKLKQAQQAVTDAQTKLNDDQAASASAQQIASDQASLNQAQSSLQTTSLQVSQSNLQASQQVSNASLSYQSAQLQYQSKISPAANATILADQSSVATAQSAVNSAQAAVNAASITAPSDGLIIAVNLLTGVNAPTSGYAVEESVGPMVANASFSESDVTKLKVGQTANVTVSAAGKSVAGTLTQIVPVASTSGGSSSVASYAVTVTLTDPPDTVFSGMSATVTVTTNSVASALRVPATALSGNATSGYTVQVLNGTAVQTVSVQVGLVTSSYAQITSGLSDGEAVITGSTTTKNSSTTSNNSSGVNLGGLTGNNGGFGGPGVVPGR